MNCVKTVNEEYAIAVKYRKIPPYIGVIGICNIDY